MPDKEELKQVETVDNETLAKEEFRRAETFSLGSEANRRCLQRAQHHRDLAALEELRLIRMILQRPEEQKSAHE